jgi:hypothetical protein
MMGSNLDSFDESVLGGFYETILKARGGGWGLPFDCLIVWNATSSTRWDRENLLGFIRWWEDPVYGFPMEGKNRYGLVIHHCLVAEEFSLDPENYWPEEPTLAVTPWADASVVKGSLIEPQTVFPIWYHHIGRSDCYWGIDVIMEAAGKVEWRPLNEAHRLLVVLEDTGRELASYEWFGAGGSFSWPPEIQKQIWPPDGQAPWYLAYTDLTPDAIVDWCRINSVIMITTSAGAVRIPWEGSETGDFGTWHTIGPPKDANPEYPGGHECMQYKSTYTPHNKADLMYYHTGVVSWQTSGISSVGETQHEHTSNAESFLFAPTLEAEGWWSNFRGVFYTGILSPGYQPNQYFDNFNVAPNDAIILSAISRYRRGYIATDYPHY